MSKASDHQRGGTPAHVGPPPCVGTRLKVLGGGSLTGTPAALTLAPFTVKPLRAQDTRPMASEFAMILKKSPVLPVISPSYIRDNPQAPWSKGKSPKPAAVF